ncbi:hypothetical protein GQ43DRAFT_467603 [Delitschia confertaspora ATCC 74209]|uniref:J domain-containing protein n=1 Tax=Delitschia confertaspora ATCC 74209 TaxID=1513339 RepID=A0A9P4JXB6_9PLEO|nr:hypothetical protein GQ43DRAFT_467603 [Delitschia confertaspora ATCC 74209]
MAIQPNISGDALYALIVWQLLIPLAAPWLQTILYSIFIRAGDSRPHPSSTRYLKHRRHILTAIYAAYFLFTIYELDWHLQRTGNVYIDLGVPIHVGESALQSRFRKLAVRFHPDKIGPGMHRDAANDYYVTLKQARDIILDPVKRFAYDRFGPDILQQCQHCLTVREYTTQGLLVTVWTYGPLVFALMAANTLGFFKDGAYWRYLVILAMAIYEARTALRSDHPPLLTRVINPFMTGLGLRSAYLPFQVTSILRRASLSLAQFLGLLIPLYRNDHQTPTPTDNSEEAQQKQVERLYSSVTNINEQASRILDLESMPYRGNKHVKHELREALNKYMVQNVVNQERVVRNAIGASIKKRREGVPLGAKGNR